MKWSVKRTAETAIEPEESTLPPPANGVALYPEPSEAPEDLKSMRKALVKEGR